MEDEEFEDSRSFFDQTIKEKDPKIDQILQDVLEMHPQTTSSNSSQNSTMPATPKSLHEHSLSYSSNSFFETLRHFFWKDSESSSVETESNSFEDNPRRKLIKAHPRTITQQYFHYIHQAWIEIGRNKCRYILGCTSIFLVVFIVAVSLTTLSYSPVLFLGLAEASAGEIDLLLSASGSSHFSGINYTALQQVAASQGSSMAYSTARYISYEFAFNPSTCTGWNQSNPTNNFWTYQNYTYPPTKSTTNACHLDPSHCINYYCPPGTLVTLMSIDTHQEAYIGLGREWTFPPVPRGHCYIQNQLANKLDLNVNDTILIAVDFGEDYEFFAMSAGFNKSVDSRVINLLLIIDQILDSSYGKFDSGYNNIVMIEYQDLLELFENSLPRSASTALKTNLLSVPRYDYVTNVIFNYPAPRFDAYMSSSFSTNARTVITWASSIMYTIGVNQYDETLPVLAQLKTTRSASSFLGLILNLIILLLSGISILLIYSLLLVSVESRTFELGIFRMIGLNRFGLVQMLIVHAMMFALPAWALGLLIGQFAFVGVGSVLADLTHISVTKSLTSEAIGVATVLGIAIPLIAAVFPIRNALTKNLHDALDTQRSKVKAIMITVERSSSEEYSRIALVVGILTSAVGILLYYILPLALISSNITLLFNIFLLLLAGMLIGMVLLSLNLQPILENFLVWITFKVFFFENRALPQIIMKNLNAHRSRNRKTAITYASALGFLIFLSVAVNLEVGSSTYAALKDAGTVIKVAAFSFHNGTAVSIEPAASLEAWALQQPHIVDFAWVSYHVKDCWNQRIAVSVANLGRYIVDNTQTYAVSPNIWEVFVDGFTIVGLQDVSSPFSLAGQLYSPKGSDGVITGSYYITRLGLNNLDKEFMIRIQINTLPLNNYTNTIVRPIALLDNTALFDMTNFPDDFQDSTVSFPFHLNLTSPQYLSVNDIPLRWFFIKLKSGLSNSQIDSVIRSMPHLTVGQIEDARGQFGFLVNQQATIVWIFEIVTVFTLLIAFFSLNTSMYTNINEQTKEIGILRALGISRFPIFRIYGYEAFFLVLSSAILGCCIGILIGWSISAQRALFTQIPLGFVFPWDLALITLAVAVVCAILATVLPVWRLVMMSVVGILRIP